MNEIETLSKMIINFNNSLSNYVAALAILQEHCAPHPVVQQIKDAIKSNEQLLLSSKAQLDAATQLMKQADIPAGSMD